MENNPIFIKRGAFTANDRYRQWFIEIKQRLQSAQVKAAIRVNTTMLEFYWSLGRDIVTLKAEQAWGNGVIEHLSLDLKDVFPNMKGLSYTNLKYASQWYRFYCDDKEIRQQLVGELAMPEKFGLVPWGHHIHLIAKCKSVEEALFYMNKTIEGNWSRSRMDDEIADGLFGKQGKAITNFSVSLPQPQSDLAREILKDPYHFDFLTLSKGYTESNWKMLWLTTSPDFCLKCYANLYIKVPKGTAPCGLSEPSPSHPPYSVSVWEVLQIQARKGHG